MQKYLNSLNTSPKNVDTHTLCLCPNPILFIDKNLRLYITPESLLGENVSLLLRQKWSIEGITIVLM